MTIIKTYATFCSHFGKEAIWTSIDLEQTREAIDINIFYSLILL